jgi:rod shape-determining protein MreC
MKHFFTTTVKVVLITAVLLAVALAVLGNLLGKTPADILVQGLLTPLRSGASTLTAQAEKYYNYMFRYEALEAENAALRAQLAEMEEAARDADAVARENDRLRDLLEMDPVKEGYTLVDAYIISWGTTDWNSSFTINRGTAAGIQVGMCAITANKEVVGLVTEAGPNYAVIKTVLDSSLEISASVATSGYSGMVQGGYAQEQEGLLRMEYLPTSAVLRNHDQVVTAGSTVYPRNLILGYIIDAGIDDTGVAKYAILEPAADIKSLEQVFILTDFTME